MTRRYTVAALLLVAFVAGQAYAASGLRLLLPFVARDATAQVATEIHLLVSGDNSYISAARSPAGCVFFAYIDRDSGNLLRVVRRNADYSVTDIPLPPPVNAVTIDPGFVPPGPKHADVSIVFTDAMELYYTSRQPDQPSGPFNVFVLRMAIPPCG